MLKELCQLGLSGKAYSLKSEKAPAMLGVCSGSWIISEEIELYLVPEASGQFLLVFLWFMSDNPKE